ncbi:MAG TPA: FMN-binding glutamate synthase family protein, partial [Bacteroidales bacterium]|nr:FMN-binding glutamate synthase family protein [Bacteroidales bacterium]
LHRMPVEDNATMDLKVTIGPKAEKPLVLDIPIYITGMSYGGALSKSVKIALAKAANQLGTATNTGEAGFLPEERETANKLIGQYNRGGYLNTPDKYGKMDAVEIQLGQGAQGASPQRTKAKLIDEEMRKVFGVKEGEDCVLHTRLPGVNSPADFIREVKTIKENTPAPVGLKIAASHYLEQEMTIALEAGVDFLTIDGAEGATHGAAPTLEDDLGLPSMFAIARARRFLDHHDPEGRVTLLAGGGLYTPGHFLKAIALGADAVYTGSAAIMALMASQILKAAPAEPSTQLVLHSGLKKDDFDIEQGAMSLGNFLRLSVKEIMGAMYALGKPSISQINQEDLCSLDPFLARTLHLQYGGVSPTEQDSFFNGINMDLGNQPNPYRAEVPLH